MRHSNLIVAATAAVSAIFALGAASAADLPARTYTKAPVAVAATYNWTGFYIGVHGGGDWFNKSWYLPPTPINCGGFPNCVGSNQGDHSASSWLAGGQAGYNYQVGQWVLGVEGQASWTNLRGSNGALTAPNNITDNSKTSALGTLGGRVGYAFDRFMIFGKAGGAWAHDKFWTTAGVGAAPAFVPGTIIQSADSDRFGWMLGIGAEYALTANWSVKIEYDYMDFGTHRETLQPVLANQIAVQYDVRQRVDLVKAGVNYRFGGPVVARY